MRWSWLLLLSLCVGWCATGCDDGGGDGDGDADSDGDADADGDVEDDGDVDAGCDPDECDSSCAAAGEVSGECREGECVCLGDPGGPWEPQHEEGQIIVEWDPDCLSDEPSDLLEEVLVESGIDLEQFIYTDEDWSLSNYASVLEDEALLSWFYEVQHYPLRVPCFTSWLVTTLDEGADRGELVSSSIATGAWATDLPVRPLQAPPRPANVEHPLAEAVGTFIEQAGGDPNNEELESAAAAVPAEVQAAAAVVIRAMSPVITAREAWLEAYDIGVFPVVFFYRVLTLAMFTGGSPVDITDRAIQDLLVGPERGDLYQAAFDLALAVESVDWDALTGTDASFRAATPAGLIVIGGSGNDVYEEDDLGEDIALMIELGGDDVYRVRAGANGSGENPVSLHIDLGGSDRYGYEEVGDRDDTDYLLPSDSASSRYQGDDSYGPITLSTINRQGAGVLGVGMLWDLGDGDDHYQSLRVSQGVGFLGVGVLYDAGGSDTYLSEASSQGAAFWGIGAMLDAGEGDDERRMYHQGQGFGYVGAAGLLYDGGGSDGYLADIGAPDLDGHPIYFSPQRPGTGNSSFTGGAGFGRRADEDGVFLSGGLGLLRDRGDSDDVYTASVFGLGTGYWQGTGLLVDEGGDDRYDAIWYIMGGAAHYALAALFDRAGNDTYNELRGTVGVNQGSGHDFSVGLLWDGAGDDWHFAGGLGMGTGNCTGIGLYVDAAGSDTYVASSGGTYGMARTSGECDGQPGRQRVATMGYFVDCGGDDDYSEVPDGTGQEGTIHRDNDTTWVYTGTSEHDIVQFGGGIDGSGGGGLSLP